MSHLGHIRSPLVFMGLVRRSTCWFCHGRIVDGVMVNDVPVSSSAVTPIIPFIVLPRTCHRIGVLIFYAVSFGPHPGPSCRCPSTSLSTFLSATSMFHVIVGVHVSSVRCDFLFICLVTDNLIVANN